MSSSQQVPVVDDTGDYCGARLNAETLGPKVESAREPNKVQVGGVHQSEMSRK